MTPQSPFIRSFTLSLVLHAGGLGVLVLLALNAPRFSDLPLTVRILEKPAGPALSAPPPAAVPPADRAPGEVQGRGDQRTMEGVSREPLPAALPPAVRRGQAGRAGGRDNLTEGGNRLASTPGVSGREGFRDLPAVPSPPVASRKLLEDTLSPPEPRRDLPRDVSLPILPDRSGLSLGGPPRATPELSEATRGAPSPGAARRSLRDQIASLGSGLEGDAGGVAKQTVSLDSRDPLFLSYLARVKRRIERVWVYPEEALNHGVGGDLLLIFTLNKAGSLANIRLVHSSGFPILDEEALRAVKLAAPFDPFPPQMGDEPWNISASFHYNLPVRFRRN